MNGSGSEKTLTEVKKALTDKGYKVSKTTKTTSTAKTTIINKTDVDSKFEENDIGTQTKDSKETIIRRHFDKFKK